MMRKLLITCLLLGLALAVQQGATQAQVAIEAEAAQRSWDSADYVLIIDNSGSMLDNDPDVLRVPAARLFIDLANDNDRIGLVAMSSEERTGALTDGLVALDATESRSQLKRGLKESIAETEETFYGGTYIGNALQIASDMLANAPDAGDRPQYIILLTDGLPDPLDQGDVAAELIAKDVAETLPTPVFTIALGEEADRDWLGEALSYPTGGLVFRASTANELISVYLQISSYLFDNRYIDSTVVTRFDREGLIFTVIPEQQIHTLTFVIERPRGEQITRGLYTPEGVNLLEVAPGAYGVFRSVEPDYELFTISSNTSLKMDGVWQLATLNDMINLPDTTIHILAQSDWRTRMTLPAPSLAERDQSVRFVPAARSSLLQVGMLDQAGNWQAGMGPSVQVLNEIWLETGKNPFVRADRSNAALYGVENDVRLENGSFKDSRAFQFRVEIPIRSPNPVHLFREYPIEVLPLPILELTLPDEALRLNANEPFAGSLSVVDSAEMALSEIERLELFVAEPGQPFRQIEYRMQSERDVAFEYVPQLGNNGSYQVRAIAHMKAADGSREVRYSDYTKESVDITVLPTVIVTTVDTTKDFLLLPTNAAEQIQFTLETNTWRDETVKVQFATDQLEGVSYEPTEIFLPAGQTRHDVTVSVLTSDVPNNAGALEIGFASTDETLTVQHQPHRLEVQVADFVQVAQLERQEDIMLGDDSSEISVRIRSRAAQSQVLRITPKSLQMSSLSVQPARINVPPNTETNYTFRVDGALEEGIEQAEVALQFSAEGSELIVLNNETSWPVVNASEELPLLELGLVVIIIICTGYWYAQRQNDRDPQFEY